MFRKMTSQDCDAIISLWRISSIRIEPEDTPENIARFLERPQSAGFVMTESADIVGAALCGSDGRYGYIHHVAVHPTNRRHGVGKVLVNACVEFLTVEQQVANIAVFVWAQNREGTNFWIQSGFQVHEGLCVLSLPTHMFKETRQLSAMESAPGSEG